MPVDKKPSPAPAGDLQRDVAAAARPDMVRVAPDVWIWQPRDPATRVPQYGLLKWAPVPGGYRPVPLASRFAVIDAALLAFLGFRRANGSVSDATLRRLAAAEEITIVHIAPRVRLLDLDSWYRFLDDCLGDPEKWADDSTSTRNYVFKNNLGAKREPVIRERRR